MDGKCFGEMNAISQPQNVRIEQHSSSIRLEATSSSAPTTTSVHSSSSPSSQQAQAASLTQTDKAHHGSTSTTFSTVSTLSSSTSTSEQGGDSSASSSGVATMSSNDHIPCSNNINGANLLTSGSPSSSSNPSPTLVPLHLDTFTKKNSGFGIGFFTNRSISQIEKSSAECNKALEPPGISQRCSSRASSGKNSPLPQLTSPNPASVFSAESAKEMICVPLRTMVSQNRRRFQSDGFNLDLTYITDRIIAMGYPADTAESLYRNNMKHIVKFLEKFHPDKYKVFNLRGQYAYDEKNFHYRVVSYEMKDHHPPRLELMAPFCREVHDHLEKDPTNVVAVHCKAGKGRTGVMICAYLYYIKFFENPRQIMDYYSIVRTHNNKGVTIPSQRRYVYYFSHLRDKQLNYLPLKIELVGIYIERPPKTRALLGKGSINLRVANGDIDVFHGAELSLSSDDYEKEDEMWSKYPNMIGEDSYDPYNPQPGKDCISRRCYGWTVPSNARVFLEGDIRVDVVKSPPLSFLPRKPDKIGHIWFNTMFTCPSFCGGAYMHGDEAFPYPDDGATIVSKVTKQKSSITDQNPIDDIPKSCSVSEHRVHSTSSFSASVPNSPPCHKLNFSLGMPNRVSAPDGEPIDSPPAVISSSNRSGSRTPSIGQHKSSSSGLKLNGMAKKLVEVLEPKKAIRHCDRSSAAHEGKCERWSSQDGGIAPKRNDIMDATKPSRASLDCMTDYDNNENEAIIVRKPPGLDGHCPEESLQHIYPNGNAPRHNIEEMLRVAYRKNLIKDGYNARRLSVPKEGNLMPKAENSSSRPLVGGPFCLMRKPDEHVSTYPVMEIDRAYKNKEIDCGFKIHIVTRCLNTSAPTDVKLAENFINVTRKKQEEKDSKKHETMKGKKYAEEAKRFKGTGTVSSESSDQNDDNSSVENSDIKNDPHLRKFFFRQRVTSASKHPNYRYNCSLYKTETISGNRIAVKPDRPTIEENLNELRNDSVGSNLDTENSSPQSDTTIIPAVHGRSATISTTGEESAKQLEVAPSKPTLRTRSARSATVDKSIKKQSMVSTTSDHTDNIHPSDCSWTSSSTSSSCRSLDEAEDNDANSSNSDSATIRRPAESFSDDKRQI